MWLPCRVCANCTQRMSPTWHPPTVEAINCFEGPCQEKGFLDPVPGMPAFSIGCGVCKMPMLTVLAAECCAVQVCGHCDNEVTYVISRVRPADGEPYFRCEAHMSEAEGYAFTGAR